MECLTEKFSNFDPLAIFAKDSILHAQQLLNVSGLLKLLSCGSKKDTWLTLAKLIIVFTPN